MWTEITDLIVLGRNYWSSCRVLCEFHVCALHAELMEVDGMEASQRYFKLPPPEKDENVQVWHHIFYSSIMPSYTEVFL